MLKEAKLEKLLDSIWSFGPKNVGPNILFNQAPSYRKNGWSSPYFPSEEAKALPEDLDQLESSISYGFQLAAAAGPLCEVTP